jgi:hypothetical protein
MLLLSFPVLADIVECDNGDRYNGRVLLLNEKELKLKNDIQGVIVIPRAKIISIQFRSSAVAKSSARPALQPALRTTNGPVQFDPSAVAKIQQQFLGDANPEANKLFQEMVSGLMNGKLDLNDIRSQAQTSLDELQKLQGDAGGDEDSQMLQSYITLLQSFLKSSPAATNSTPLVPQKAPKAQVPAAAP